MNCKIKNMSDMDLQDLSPLIDDLASAVQQKVGFKYPPTIMLQDDEDNAQNILGKTAHYDPQNKLIVVYVTKRHPKDILRSIAHELVHHGQNLRGEFDKIGSVGEGYAQNDEHLREMEREAYEQGNMCFRDWEDGHKRQMMESIHRQNSFKRRNNTMKVHKWKNNELNKLLMEKFNLGESWKGNRSEDKKKEDEEIMEAEYNRDEDSSDEGDSESDEVQDKKKADLNKDGKLSGYETKRAKAIEKSMKDDKKMDESFRTQIRNMLEEILKIK